MEEYIKNIEEKLSDVQYILLAVITSFLIKIPLQELIYLCGKYGVDLGARYMDESMAFILINACIIGPILESFLIIFFIWILKDKFHIKKKLNLLLITSVIFALMHYYSIMYIIAIFPDCFIIVYSYLCYRSKKLSSFKVMLLVHMIINTSQTLLGLL
ncbi:type II CAAX prenyl endopeptidase Rce1 family protein [Clostridium sp. DSM 1985]|nr:CPBP family glutamic-type intramembrane protease [Clostridium sp. DSM 1985]